jgi:diguanylate cyclase (GGDEF)-like protein
MRILIAEDDRVSQLVLRKTLQVWGYDAVVVDNGEAALTALLDPDGPQIAVLDWMMPGLTGPEVCRRVREDGPEAYRYLIVLTGRTQTADLVEGLDAGADDFLAKPSVREELQARIRAGQRILDLHNQLLAARQALIIQATRDPLTGVFNRRALMERMELELSRAARGQSKRAGVLMLDLDHFKHVNDTYGHLAGDQVLIEATRRFQAALRDYDVLGRYGGEEFVVLVPDATEAVVAAVAERLRACVADAPIIHGDGHRIAVTTSVGAHISAPGQSCLDAIQAADEALYTAKRAGRNRVCSTWGQTACAA